jgi:hypothetical protein
MAITVYPFCEIGRVSLTVSTDGSGMALDLTVVEARDLAKQLTEAADHVDQWNRDVEDYFASHGGGGGSGGEGVHMDDSPADSDWPFECD